MPFIGPLGNLTYSPRNIQSRFVLLRVDVGIDPYDF